MGRGRGAELRVLQTQACDRSYIDDPNILTNATTNNHLKSMYGGGMLGSHTGDEPTMIAAARNLGAQGANLKNLANDLSGKRAKGGGNASQGPFWRGYKHGMTQGQWRIINVSLSGQIIGYNFNENVSGRPQSCIASCTLTTVTWRHDVTDVTRTEVDEFEYHLFGNFQVQRRNNGNQLDLFPNPVTGIKISHLMADQDGVSRQYKLWDHIKAVNSSLCVRLAKWKNHGGNWVSLPAASHPAYELGDVGCFDMMFVAPPPLINTGY